MAKGVEGGLLIGHTGGNGAATFQIERMLGMIFMSNNKSVFSKVYVVKVCLAGLMFSALPAFAQSQDSVQKLATMGAQFAGSNAHVASDLCGVDASTLSKYKDAQKKQFAQDSNFEADWQTGWQKAQKTVTGYAELKSQNPKEYEAQRAASCSEMSDQFKQ
jgi:hypothetical protein